MYLIFYLLHGDYDITPNIYPNNMVVSIFFSIIPYITLSIFTSALLLSSISAVGALLRTERCLCTHEAGQKGRRKTLEGIYWGFIGVILGSYWGNIGVLLGLY